MFAASITKPERMDLNHRQILALEKGCCRNHKHDLHFHELLYQLSYSPKSRGEESNLRRRHPMQRIILLSESQNMIPCQYCVLPLNYLSLISSAYSQIYFAPLTNVSLIHKVFFFVCHEQQGYRVSNPEMHESKSCALPFGDSPKLFNDFCPF